MSTEINNTNKEQINLLIHQWNKLSDRVDSIDNGHWQVFTLVLATFGLFSLANSEASNELSLIYWVMPIVTTIVVFFEAYRLRELALLKGYLARIEDRINSYFDDSEPMSWFLKYKVEYSYNNSIAKKHIKIPIVIAYLFVMGLCVVKYGRTLSSLSLSYAIIYGILLVITIVSCFAMGADIMRSEKLKYDVYINGVSKPISELWHQEMDSSCNTEK